MKEYRYEGARCQNALSSWVDLIPPSKASSKCNPISNSGNQFSSGISLQTICAVDKVVAVRLYEDSLIKADIKRFNKLTKPASNQIPTKGYLIQLNVGVLPESVHPGGGMAEWIQSELGKQFLCCPGPRKRYWTQIPWPLSPISFST